jgi:hypothetical protein
MGRIFSLTIRANACSLAIFFYTFFFAKLLSNVNLFISSDIINFFLILSKLKLTKTRGHLTIIVIKYTS